MIQEVETWGLKPLAAVYPCKLSTAMKKYCDENCVTYFTTYAKKNITSSMGGKVLGNEWIDTIRFRDWLQNDMQERVFNLLVLNQKVPFTDEGITAIEGKMEESLKEGQKLEVLLQLSMTTMITRFQDIQLLYLRLQV